MWGTDQPSAPMRLRSGATVLLAALTGCAHASPPPPPAPATVTVTVSENGMPHADGPTVTYRVCVDPAGKPTSVTPLHTIPVDDKKIQEGIRRLQFPSRPIASCAVVRLAFDMEPPAPAGARPSFAPTTVYRNLPPQAFDAEVLARPLPSLPTAVRLAHVDQRLAFTAKVCAGSDGHVDGVTVLRGIPGADAAIVQTIGRWRMRPQPDGRGVCTIERLVYDIHAARR